MKTQLLLSSLLIVAFVELSRGEGVDRDSILELSGLNRTIVEKSRFLGADDAQSGGLYSIAAFALTNEAMDVLLADRFFDWWVFGGLKDGQYKETYGLADERLSRVDKGLLPGRFERVYYLEAIGPRSRRLYILMRGENDARLYFFRRAF